MTNHIRAEAQEPNPTHLHNEAEELASEAHGAPEAQPRPPGGAFDLKGTVSTLTVLRLRTLELEVIGRELSLRIAQLPHFFMNAPVVLDFSQLVPPLKNVPFAQLVTLLRDNRLVPVAVRHLESALQEEATRHGLGLLREGLSRPIEATLDKGLGRAETAEIAEATCAAPSSNDRERLVSGGPFQNNAATVEPLAEPAVGGPFGGLRQSRMGLMVRLPVRAGQVVFAEGTDLVALAPVNSGAEVIADGNIHVYAPLRGRALAGAHGNEGARIFCRSLEAELVSIAGHYLRSEDFPDSCRGRPAQIYIEEGRLVVGVFS
jgi:septum site-determining protein MinC